MNCKPGDLAVVTNSPIHENNGRIVEVLRPQYVLPYVGWWIRVVSPMFGHDTDAKCNRWAAPGEEGLIPDSQLRPISGVPITEEEETECPTTV